MLFQDQAQQLVSRWETLKEYDDLDTLAAQTAIALSCMPDVPEPVLDALDELLEYRSESHARHIIQIVRYLRSLASDRLRLGVNDA